MNLQETTEFAYEAMRDSRDTIRAIDFKANALLVVLAIVGANIEKLAGAERFLFARAGEFVCQVLLTAGTAGALAWLISLLASCMILVGKYDPIGLVVDREGASGVFFSAASFPMSIWRFPLWPRSMPASLAMHCEAMTLSDSAILREICFEHLKLTYIRQAKSIRLRSAFTAGFVSFLLLAIMWIGAIFAGFNTPTAQ